MKQFTSRFLIAGLLATSLISARTFKVNLSNKVIAGQNQLMPGTYLLEVDGSKALLKDKAGKTEAEGKVESTSRKASDTSIEVNTSQAANRLDAINPAGSRIHVVFE